MSLNNNLKIAGKFFGPGRHERRSSLFRSPEALFTMLR